jgi:hypothetical protein
LVNQASASVLNCLSLKKLSEVNCVPASGALRQSSLGYNSLEAPVRVLFIVSAGGLIPAMNNSFSSPTYDNKPDSENSL